MIALAGAPALADGKKADEARLRDAERAIRQADRAERMLEAQHQQWQQQQRDIPRLIEPKPLQLGVPIYTSPKL
ncbi:hypothetical protein [Nitratireductor soli]|uniref:hypothetical protein n=1 Tax=Nitratireductor soli TaxID=1670619 RepID=UPI000ADC1607|nr:hypothetical protein [Nitratireductor soli]